MKFVHVWFSTKYRLGALENPQIARLVVETMRAVAVRTGVDIVEIETAVDHMHLLLRLEENQQLSVVMHDLKGASSRAIHAADSDLQLDMGTFALWQRGYGSRIVPPSQLDTVKRYIRSQMDRPLRQG